jgi:hypothetical protein
MSLLRIQHDHVAWPDGVRATRDAAGVSWSWAALTTLNNAAWIAYFALSRDWSALVPSCSVTLLAGALTVMLTGWQRVRPRSLALMGAWAAALAAVGSVDGRVALGTLLTAAFVVQVAPSLRAAYLTPCPSGISAGTWTLILGELACFLAYGLHQADPRLIALGSTGVVASALMLSRIIWTGRLRGPLTAASELQVNAAGDQRVRAAADPDRAVRVGGDVDAAPAAERGALAGRVRGRRLA